MNRFLLAIAFTLAAACNDRGDRQDVLIYTPPAEDAGVDAEVEPAPPKGPPCDGRNGSSCRSPRAYGVCIDGECQRIACESAYVDCDGDEVNGCETRADVGDACGACGVTCDEGDACQFGELGFTCSSEVVCELPLFDVDLSLGNGCEWESGWGDGFVSPENPIRVHSLFHRGGAPFVLATRDDAALLATLPDLVETDLGPASGDPQDVVFDEDELLIVWEGAVQTTRFERSGSRDTLVCAQPNELRSVARNNARRLVGFESGVVSWENEDFCDDCTIVGRYFEREDYLAAFWPGQPFGFSPDEVASCTPCSIDPETGERTQDAKCDPQSCRPNGEPVGCDACDPSGCPELNVVKLLASPSSTTVYVVTTRGVLAMSFTAVFEPLWRLERTWDPEQAAGLSFLDATLSRVGDRDQLTLLDNAGRIMTIDVVDDQPVPTSDVLVGEGQRLHQFGPVRLVTGATDLLFLGEQQRSAAIARIGVSDGPTISGLSHLASTSTETGFQSLYEAPGVYFLRTFER